MSLCWFANHDYSSQNRSYVLRFLNADSVMQNHLYLQYSMKILVKTVWKRSSTFGSTFHWKKDAHFLKHNLNWMIQLGKTEVEQIRGLELILFTHFIWTDLEDFTWTTATDKCINSDTEKLIFYFQFWKKCIAIF